jgi:hypothetical protein
MQDLLDDSAFGLCGCGVESGSGLTGLPFACRERITHQGGFDLFSNIETMRNVN